MENDLNTKHDDTYYTGPTEDTKAGRSRMGQVDKQVNNAPGTEVDLYPSLQNDRYEKDKTTQKSKRRSKGIASIDSHTLQGDAD